MNINEAYINVCRHLYERGNFVGNAANPRGATKELRNYMFTVDVSKDWINLVTRNTSLTYLLAETVWYLSGRNDVKFIGQFAKLWTKLTDDGVTNNSAYGYILQSKHGFNQITRVIELLKADPNSRRAVMNINVPNKHVIETKDEPCTICLEYIIRDNKLHCTAVMRSNDINYGLPYDFTFFVLLQKYIANELGLEAGTYTHFAMSIHYYIRDEELVKKIAYGGLEERPEKIDFNALNNNLTQLNEFVDTYAGESIKQDFLAYCKELGVVQL